MEGDDGTEQVTLERAVVEMRRWRLACFVLVAVGSLFVGYSVVSLERQVATISRLRGALNDATDDLRVLTGLAPALRRGMSQRDVVQLLREQHPEAVIVDEGRTVQIGQLLMRFDQEGRLHRIERTTDTPAPSPAVPP